MPLESPVRQGKAENESGEAIATIWPEGDGLMFAMDYRSRPLKTEWGVRLRGAINDSFRDNVAASFDNYFGKNPG
jgi:hypothetical protein